MSAVQPVSAPAATGTPDSGVTARAVVIAVILVFLVNLAVSRIELIIGRYVASGIPPIPAVLVLALLAAFTPLVRRIARPLALGRREILTIYALMLVSVPFSATYGIRSFLPRLTVMQYYATPENHFGEYTQHLPSWFAPEDMQQVQAMYEGGPSPAVPWGVWVKPLGLWLLFFVFLFITTLSLMTIMARQWSDGERLPYPLVQLPMEMVDPHRGTGMLANFFGNPLAWIGIGLALLYNALNIANAFNPAVPSIKQDTSLDYLFTERPWDAMRPLILSMYPGRIGFGYLVSQELLASVVAFTFVAKFASVVGRITGYEPPGFPYWQEQSAGGYVALALFMLWAARGHLRNVWRKGLGDLTVDDSDQALPYRWALLGLAAGTIFFLAWTSLAGMSWQLALPFWAIVLCFGLTYGRVRAEAGIPDDFVYPYRLPQVLIINALGPRTMLRMGGPQSIVIMEVMSFLSRFHPTQIMTAYQADVMQIAKLGQIRRRTLAWAMVLLFICGLVFAFWGHFTTFYGIGLNVLEGNPRNADWRTNDTIGAFGDMVTRLEHPVGPDATRTGWAIGGGLFAIGLALARTVWLRFPLHPLGYVVALAYGPSTSLWFPFLLVFVVKWLLLKIGGIGSFRRLIPLFIGLVVGHYVFAGVAWPLISLFYENSISGRYYTVF